MPPFSKLKSRLLGKSTNEPPSKPPVSGCPSSPLAATSTTSSASEPVSPPATHVNQSSPEHAQPSAPGSPGAPPAQPAASAPAPTPQENEVINVEDLWRLAYEAVQEREKDLMKAYEEYLATHPAIQKHHAITSSDLLSNAETVESIVQQLQDDRKNKQWQIHFGSKNIAIRDQVETLAKFLLWSDKFVSAAVSSQPYAALAWTGVSLLLPLLTSGTTQNESMLEGFNHVGDIKMYWQSCEQIYLQPPHGQNYRDLLKPLVKLYSYIIEYEARVICHLSSGQLSHGWRDISSSDYWKTDDIERENDNCNRLIPALERGEVRKYQDQHLQTIEKSLKVQIDTLQFLQDSEQERKTTNLLRDLSLAVATYERDKDINPKRVHGTCEWFFTDPIFCDWRDATRPGLLWFSAGPGCGKSVLSRSLIDEGHLEKSSATMTLTTSTITTSPPSTICYFFFKDGDKRRVESAHALSAILHQLFNPKAPTSGLIKYALESHKAYGQALAENSSELWRVLFLCAENWQGEIICVLDALDECQANSRMDIIETLHGFYSTGNSSSKLKLLITGRPTTQLKDLFASFSAMERYRHVDSDDTPDAISRDIDKVIDIRVNDVLSSFTQKDRDKISERLKSVKNRTYLWLYLTFDSIEKRWKHSRVSDVEAVLNGLPMKLSQAYERILSRSTNQKRAKILLQIVLAAARPLTLDEANVALTLAVEKQRFSSHQALEEKMWSEASFPREVDALCGLFINVYDDSLFFLHQTAQTFLTGEGTEEGEGEGEEEEEEVEAEQRKQKGRRPREWKWKGRLSMATSHSILTQACLDYLSLTDLLTYKATISQDGSVNVDPTDDIEDSDYFDSQYRFFHYAAFNWPLHYASQVAVVANETRKDARMLCRTNDPQPRLWISRYFAWNRVDPADWTDLSLDPTDWTDLSLDPADWTDLSFASYLNLVPIVEDILAEENVDVNGKGGRFGTALQTASARGHSEIVRLLLDKGADVNIRGGLYGTALLAASTEGHELVAQMLLDANADVNTRNREDQTALSIAAQRGYTAIVKSLLMKAVEVDLKDYYDQTPLSWAAIYGHSKIVKLLLQKGANVDSKDNIGYTPLSFAAIYAPSKIVKLLLQKGANVDSIACTRLLFAARNGHQEAIRLLTEASGSNVFLKAASARGRYARDGKDFEEVFVALVGPTGCGKSSLIKLLTGQDVPIGHTREACTTEVTDFFFVYKNFRVHLLDTPGLDDMDSHPEHMLMTYLPKDHIALTGMMYLDRITNRRPAAGIRVLKDVLQALKARMGWNCLGKLFTATTHWDDIDPRTALASEKHLVQSERHSLPSSKVFRHWNTRWSALTIIDGILDSVGAQRS